MPKTSEEMRRLAEEYIKITGIKYEDQTRLVRNKTDTIQWQFHVGRNIIVSKNANRDDRIHISANIRFMPGDSGSLVMTNPAFARATAEISEICTTCGVGHQWVKAENEIVGLAIFSHVDEMVLDRVTFHNTWDNVARVSGHVQKILQADLGRLSRGMMQDAEPEPESSSSIYG